MKVGFFVWAMLSGIMLAQQPEGDIRGPKPLIEVPVVEVPTPWWTYPLWGALALLVIGGVIWMIKQRTRPEVTAEERARLELEQLGKEGTHLPAGDFALAASQVVRDFIERRFAMAAPKRTTEEFLQELAAADDDALRSRMEPLRGFLKSCDMAKFAGANLAVGERGKLVACAREFIDTPEEPQPKEAA
jgi:hypothetical protein